MAPRSKKRRRSSAPRVAKPNGQEEEEEEQGGAEQGTDETIVVDETMAHGEDAQEEAQEEEREPTEQEIEEWESFREEFYDIVHDLPVSLQRSYRLMRESDDQAESFNEQLLPAIKEYIAFRKALANPPEPLTEEAAGPSGSSEAVSEPAPSINGISHTSPNGVATSSSTTQDDTQVCGGPSPADSQDVVPMNDLNTPINGPRKRKRAALDDLSPRRSPRTSRQSSSSPTKPSTPKTTSPTTPPMNGTVPITPNPAQVEKLPVLPVASSSTAKELEPPAATTKRMLQGISHLADEAVRASDEKLGIAMAMYDLVDRHVRSLDAKIQEYEASLSIGLRPGTHPLDGTLTFGNADRSTVSVEPELSRGRKRDRKGKRRAVTDEVEEAEEEHEGRISSVLLELAGMPVNAAEPKYCYCNRVSFGTMVGCDGPGCPHGGWFHLECVGLKEPPRGSFFCDDCRKEHPRPQKRKR